MSVHFVLERDGHDQPWGFRLQGGTDVGLPLSIQRVLVGTPAESILKRGDVVTKIGNMGTHSLTHQQAVDLFSATGNTIEITVKRVSSGAPQMPSSAQPSVSSLQASAALRQQQQQQQQLEQPPQSPQVAALPRTTFVLKSELPSAPPVPIVGSTDRFSVTNQPYRTLPLVQPSIKVLNEIGIGSYSHLKYQEEICAGVREPQLFPVPPAKANQIKAYDLLMKQKTQQGLVNAASDHQKSAKSPVPVPTTGPIPGPVPIKLPPSPSLPNTSPQPAKYNSAAGLYANQNSGHIKSGAGTGMINPVNKPPKHLPFFALAKKYDPEQSATWQAIHEQENCQLITEHGPTESKVYSI